ncbi:C1q and tumor necrosis factor-related protein 3 isoform, partial [Daphnia pulex]
TSFSPQNTPIPFELARVNEGNAMDLTSGKFTAPRPGIYFFSFAGNGGLTSSSTANFYFRLFLNGNLIGSTHVHEMNGPVSKHSPMSFQSTLNLKTGDQVWVQMEYSPAMYLSDESTHTTHFTGFMLEEEIVAAL